MASNAALSRGAPIVSDADINRHARTVRHLVASTKRSVIGYTTR
jgi:hypothetical protein